MNLEYELTIHDYMEFNKFHFWYSPDNNFFRIKLRLIIGIFLFLLPYILLFTCDISFNQKLILNLLPIGAFTFFAGFLNIKRIYIRGIERRVERTIKAGKNMNLLGRRKIEFTEASIEWNMEYTEGKINSQAIEKMREDNNYYYIYTNISSAFIVPKRALATDQEKEDFEAILSKIRAIINL